MCPLHTAVLVSASAVTSELKTKARIPDLSGNGMPRPGMLCHIPERIMSLPPLPLLWAFSRDSRMIFHALSCVRTCVISSGPTVFVTIIPDAISASDRSPWARPTTRGPSPSTIFSISRKYLTLLSRKPEVNPASVWSTVKAALEASVTSAVFTPGFRDISPCGCVS